MAGRCSAFRHNCLIIMPLFAAPVPRHRVVSPLLAIVLIAGLATACKPSADGNADSAGAVVGAGGAAADDNGGPQLALPVTANEAREGDLVLRVNTTGQVRSDAAVKLRAEVAGTIASVLVRPGTRVSKGQVLIKLDPYPFDLAVREAQAVADESEQRYFESFVPESLVTGRGPNPEQRKALMNKAGLVGAKLRLERAQFEQSRATITSPVDGMVDLVDVAAGERVTGGQHYGC
jgi:multidrug efflux pump subunit AcrA (membrane-fusion protein)